MTSFGRLSISSHEKNNVCLLIDYWEKKYPLVKTAIKNGELMMSQKIPTGIWNCHFDGWWDLTREWFELECEIDSNWQFVRPLFLDEEDWKSFYGDLRSGKFCMMVYYIENTLDGKEYIPHH